MAAKMGILGESTVITNDTTTTIYTVPTDKAARVRIQFMVEMGSGSTYQITMGSPNDEITMTRQPAGAIDCWSGLSYHNSPDPALSVLGSSIGIHEKSNTIRMEMVNPTGNWIMTSLPVDYFLNDGDTVKFRISSNDAVDHLCQVVGVEDDV